MGRNSSPTLARPREGRAARDVRAVHALDSTTYNLRDEHAPAGWSARCLCGASTGETRYPTRDDVLAAHAGHVRRYLPAGAR